jgi:hypothetical protein
MAANRFEYRQTGGAARQPVRVFLDSTTADLEVGTAVTTSGATSGYYKEVDASGEAVAGITMERVSSPSVDGGASVLIDQSNQSVYEVPPDAGSVTEALRGKTCDVGADGKSADIDASADDSIYILDVDTDANTLRVQIRTQAAAAGVA